MINNIKAFAKYLDQPILISKFDKAMPKLMYGGAILKTGYDYYQHSKRTKKMSNEERAHKNKKFLAKTIVLAAAVISAVNAPKAASFITKRTPLEKLDKVKENTTKLISDFLENNKTDEGIKKILEKGKENVLSFKEVKTLSESLNKSESGQNFFKKLIPDPENIASKDIFSEIGYLSVYGAVPVVGGIMGGVAADVLTKEDYKKKLPDKISEGLYQYLANIFMCNIGAGAALAILEKANITSKAARALGMISGIILTGVVGGSKIANLISEKMNPIISPHKKIKERKPEPIDLCMHTDDIATVSVLSGLKWIEPALPVLYSVSGYKAGVGYRN